MFAGLICDELKLDELNSLFIVVYGTLLKHSLNMYVEFSILWSSTDQ